MFENIKKRDGRIVEFDSSKITAAIAKAGKATAEFEEREAKKLTLRVLTLAHELRLGSHPEVEEVQDIVERVLLDSPFHKTAKAYILYRNNIPRSAVSLQRPASTLWNTTFRTGLENQRKQQYVLFASGTQQLHFL